MANVVRWTLAVAVALTAVGPPIAFFRYQYIHAKRFREVTPGRFYRSGQMTASGLRDVVERYGIKTVINLQHEQPDPYLPDHWMGSGKVHESELCARLGVRYLLLKPDVMPPGLAADAIPPVVDELLALLDDESNYPVLIHCKAGLHRTGRLTAIYRMEYMGWSQGEALREMRANGYGFFMTSTADDFVIQFIRNYVPRKDRPRVLPTAPRPRLVGSTTAPTAPTPAGEGGGP